jgi:EAL domain-containing protein (putative c-di-GMP-specific phosphodiesterase class I)
MVHPRIVTLSQTYKKSRHAMVCATASAKSDIRVAEGVENAATVQRLGELNVDSAQGYHIGRPAPVTPSAAPTLRTQRPRSPWLRQPRPGNMPCS